MLYQAFAPRPALAPYIECFWILEGAGGAAETIFPDGRMEIVVHLGEPFRRFHDNGEAERQARSFLVGQMNRYLRVQPPPSAAVFGIRFRPGGSQAVLGFPQQEAADRLVALDLIAKDLEPELLAAPNTPGRIAAAGRWLLRRAGRLDPLAQAAVAGITKAGGLAPIRALAANLGWSERHLERRFRAAVGMGPKMFARILRFQRALRLLEQPGGSGAARAAECGYYDQAHLIRDFQQFAGQTPSFYQEHQVQLGRFFTIPAAPSSPILEAEEEA